MKAIFFLLMLCAGLTTLTHAQPPAQSIIASAGKTDGSGTISLEWTLGEISVQTLTHPNIMLTEGFHQPWLQVEEIATSANVALDQRMEVSIFPNPTANELHIRIEAGMEGEGVLSLKMLDGRSLKKEIINLSRGYHQWNLSNYPPGLYALTLHALNGEFLQSFKITKIH